MLEIRKTAIVFNEEELLDLERIIIDTDEAEAIKFLRKAVYDKIAHNQQSKLKSYLDKGGNSVSAPQS